MAAPQDKTRSKFFDRWLKARAKSVRAPLAATIGMGAFNGFLLILQAGLLAHALTAVVIQHATLTQIVWPLTGLTLLFLLRAGVGYAQQRFAFETGARLRAVDGQVIKRDKPPLDGIQRGLRAVLHLQLD